MNGGMGMDTEARDDLYGNIVNRAADAFAMELSDSWPGTIALEIGPSDDPLDVHFSLTPAGVERLARFIRKACDAAVDATMKAKGLA